MDRWEDGAYLRAVATPQGMRLLRVTNQGSIQCPSLRLDVLGGETSPASAAEAESTVRWVLGLDARPAPVSWLRSVEPKLGPITESLLGFRTPCFPTLFETCASVLPFQQLSLDAGVAIVGRLIERFGESRVIDGHERFSFPSPASIAAASSSALREIGLSGAKASSLQKLASMTVDGRLDARRLRSLPTAEAIATLDELPGIGSWSAAVILLRGLRRLDVFPGGDVGAARNLTALIEPTTPFTPASASAFAARFGDRRGYLYFLALGEQLRIRGVLGAA